MARKSSMIFKDLTYPDIEFIAQNLRKQDVDELKAVHGEGVDILDLLYRSIKLSQFCQIGYCERTGEPVCIAGLTRTHDENVGVPWLLGTERLYGFGRAFVIEGKRVVDEMLSITKFLVNYVDCRNTAAIRWLKHIGFEIHEPVEFGVNKMPFHLFTMERMGG